MSAPEVRFTQLALNKIDPGKNVRVDDTEIDRLMESIRQHGVLQPITVVPTAKGDKVECLFGHRRLLAARRVGLATIPCMVRPRGSDQSRILTQLAENRERKQMSSLEEARAFDDLRKAGMTQHAIAQALGTQQTSVSRKLLLLKYPTCVQTAVHYRKISLNDAIGIPLAIAKEDDPTFRKVLRSGTGALRRFIADAQEREIKNGRAPLAAPRRTFQPMNLDSTLVHEANEAARRRGMRTVDWLAEVVRAALADQTSART